jgi:hypothetical protein
MLNDKGPEDDMAVRLSHVPPRVRYVCLRGCGRGLEWIAFCGKRGAPRPCCDGQLVWVGVSMNNVVERVMNPMNLADSPTLSES